MTSCFADKVSVTQAQGSSLPVSTACSSLIFVYALVATPKCAMFDFSDK